MSNRAQCFLRTSKIVTNGVGDRMQSGPGQLKGKVGQNIKEIDNGNQPTNELAGSLTTPMTRGGGMMGDPYYYGGRPTVDPDINVDPIARNRQ